MTANFVKKIESEHDMQLIAKKLAHVIVDGVVIFLNGPLGSGKTTFVRGFLHALGYEDKVKSPTYTIVEPYEIAGHKIYHFDFYRVNNAKELEAIGIHEYFNPHSICLIEWAEKGFPLLPKPDLSCHIAFSHHGREVRIVAESEVGNKIMSHKHF